MRASVPCVAVAFLLATQARGQQIASVDVDDSPQQTSVVAYDAAGNEVGRLELTHGVFTLSDGFEQDYDTPQVDGRKLSVTVGRDQLVWQTAGYTATLQLPAHPAGHDALAAFLRDARVKPMLDAWLIGFSAPETATDATSGTISGSEPGTFVADCSGKLLCGPPVQGKVPNVCNGKAPPSIAMRISRANPANEDMIAQCCPPIADTGVAAQPWFALKVCPMTGSHTSCGDVASGCKACPSYPVPAQSFCFMAFHPSHEALDYCYAPTGVDKPATQIQQLQVPQYWPPNGAIAQAELASCMQSVSDPCNPALTSADIVASPSFHLDYLGADEAGEGSAFPAGGDRVGFAVARSGALSGRTYHAGASYLNELGVRSAVDCRFGVPHDRGEHSAAADQWSGPAGSAQNPGWVTFY